MTDASPFPRPPSDDDAVADGAVRPRRIDIRTLLGRDREVLLIHREAEYRLRVTSNGKLILTK